MSYPILPALPFNLGKGFKKTPHFNVVKQPNAAGMGISTSSLMPYPTWDFEIDMDYFQGSETLATSVLATFVGTYIQCNGQGSLFLMTDPNDNSVTTMNFGTGDGATVAFQLSRTIAGIGVDVIQNVNYGTVSIYVNGVLQTLTTDYTISSTGVVTFVTAPTSAYPLTWTGNFYYLCRFDADTLEDLARVAFNQSGAQFWSVSGIKFSSEFVAPGTVGTINTALPSAVAGVAVTGIPTVGQVLTATSSTAADWQSPGAGAGVDWVNALNLGAVGNGSTDNYSAIQTWVNAQSSPAVLYFPAGTFNFATAVTLNVYVQAIYGDGIATTTLQVPNSSSTNSIFVSSATANEIATGFTIEGIYFNGPGQNASSTATGVVISNQSTNAVSFPRLINCKFANWPSYAFDLEIPILGILDSIDIVDCGRGYKINGGTSTNARAVYINNVLKQGHDWIDHSYWTMSGCAADNPGIGYLIRGGGSTLSISGCGSEVGTPLNLTVTNTVSNGTTATVTYSGTDQSAEYFTGMTVQVTGTSNGSGALNGRKVITSVSTNTISFASAASFSSSSDSGTCSMFPGDNFQFISRTCDTIESIYAAGGGSNAGGIGLLIGGTSTLMSVKGFNCTNSATYDLYTGTGCSKLLLENNSYSGGNFLGASEVETLSNGNRYIAGFVQLVSGGVVQWNADTGLSRSSAGVIDVGNGTAANASGTVNAAQYNVAGSQIAAANLANGTTGSGSIVLATSPTLSALTISGALTDSTSSTGTNGQVLSSTGSATKWITPSASGTVNAGTKGYIAWYSTTGNAVSPDTLLEDNGSVLGYGGPGGIEIVELGVYSWKSTLGSPPSGVVDTGLSRGAAGQVNVGNGTQGDFSGTIKATVCNQATGFQIGGAATSTHYLRGNGTDYVDSAIQAADVPTLNQNTSGSAASLSISGQTGLLSVTGLTSTNRIKTVRDAADTLLELGGSYTPTGIWTSMALVTPALGTPASGVITNCTGSPTLTTLTATTVVSGAGTAAAPSHTFTGATSTGLYLLSSVGSPPGSGIGFSVGGVLVFSVDDNGSVVNGHENSYSVNSDSNGFISSASGTTVSKVFSTAYHDTPTVVVTPTTNAGSFFLSSVTKTGFTVTYTSSGAQIFNYHVDGNPN